MAPAFDAVGSDYEYNVSTTGCQFNMAATASGGIAIIFLAYNPAAQGVDWANTPTVNGVSATQIGTPYNYSGTQYLRAYYFLDPPTSSVAYIASTDNVGVDRDIEMLAAIYTDANQTGQVDSSNTGTGTPTATLTTTVVASNCWLVSIGRNTTFGTVNVGTGTTNRKTGVSANIGDSGGTVGTGSQSMAWTQASGDTFGFVVSIKPTAAGGVAISVQSTLLTLGVG